MSTESAATLGLALHPWNAIHVTNNPLHNRLRYLRNAEAFAALALPAVLIWHWLQSGLPVDWALRLPPTLLVGVMLLQGAGYWHLKLESVRTRRALPSYFRPLYRALRLADLLATMAVVIACGVMSQRGAATADLAWAGGLLVFAVLEYINYFGVQLMHDNRADLQYLLRHRRLRRAALATDLSRDSEAI